MLKLEMILCSDKQLPVNWLHSLVYKLADDIPDSRSWHNASHAVFSSGVIPFKDNLHRGYITTAEEDLIKLVLSPDGLVPRKTHSAANIQATILEVQMRDYLDDFKHILERNKKIVNYFTLKFITPCFIKRGNYYDRLPSIERIISSIYNDWLNRGGPKGPSMDTLTSWISEHLLISEYQLRSKEQKFKGIPFTGMTGYLKLFFDSSDQELKSFTLALFDYASLFGIGCKNALGFGWVELEIH